MVSLESMQSPLRDSSANLGSNKGGECCLMVCSVSE